MSNRKTIAIFIAPLAVAAAVFFAGGASASKPESTADPALFSADDGPGIRKMVLNRITRELLLSEQQKAEIKSILEAERPTIEPLLRQLIATKQELRTATANGHFDPAEIAALADKQGETLSQLIVEKEKVKTKIYEVLTPEQREKLAKMLVKFEHRIRERAASMGL